MSDDLVERLRDEALDLHGMAWRNTSGGQETTMSATLAHEAADRIEALTSERDRLREALWAILACETPNANATVTRMSAITKAALKGETP